jgi:hypothetical protein
MLTASHFEKLGLDFEEMKQMARFQSIIEIT